MEDTVRDYGSSPIEGADYALIDDVGIIWTGTLKEMESDFNNAEALYLTGNIKLVKILKEKTIRKD